MAMSLHSVIFEHLIPSCRQSSYIQTRTYILLLLNKKACNIIRNHSDLRDLRYSTTRLQDISKLFKFIEILRGLVI